ncbi:hypothetical protein [Flavisolibacter nicotianae]|uniref:hypothetical protein n=1 Tax=Flavisolibacter nicotianae TaxID=2364882 RepID=UPI000EB0CBD0|nr:hypothetical protein [Flavisolibacter nicotianae]
MGEGPLYKCQEVFKMEVFCQARYLEQPDHFRAFFPEKTRPKPGLLLFEATTFYPHLHFFLDFCSNVLPALVHCSA